MVRALRPKPDAGSVVQPEPALLRLFQWDFQPFAPPYALDPLVVHMPSGVVQHPGHHAVAVAPMTARQVDRGEVESELSFSDAIKDLNFAFMGTAEARNGPWGIITDLLYFSLSSEGDSPAGLAFSGVEADSEMTVVSGYLAYRVYEDPKVAFDLGAGLRAFWINSDTSLIGAAAPTETFSYDENFVDPVVAARLRVGFNEKWAGTVFLDAGGNGDSQTWQALATVDYGLSERWSLRGGYRYMKAEWDTNFGQSSLEFSGPVLGATYRF